MKTSFVPPAARAIGIRTTWTESQSSLRKGRRVAVSRKKRLSVTCEMNDTQPSESSYLLRNSTERAVRDSSPDAGNVDIENGALSRESNDDTIDAPAPATGIVQTTADLDGRVLFGEFLSTFLFVYVSVNAASLGSPLANSLNNAAVIAAVAASFMPVSGAHLNPAVTLALAITNRVSLKRAVAFVPIQLLAAACACYLASWLGVPMSYAGIAASASRTDLIRAFFAEMVPMFIIVIVVFQTAVATEREGGVGTKLAALYIGLAVLACAGSFTGFFNPARAFGPTLVTGNCAYHWIFWIGPFVGASLAALISEHLFLAPASNRKPNSWLAGLQQQSSDMGGRIKNLGVAGLFAYGIMNTLYYGVVFSFMMFRVGWASGASGIAQAWIVTWSLSQVTKPLRLGLSIALAPIIDRFLVARKRRNKKT